MIKNIKNNLKKNLEIFALINLIIITALSTSYYNYKKNFRNYVTFKYLYKKKQYPYFITRRNLKKFNIVL